MIHASLLVAYGLHGRGVFTLQPIPSGTVVEVSPAVELRVKGFQDYVFAGSARGLSRVVFGYGMLYSHSSTPNLRVDHDATCTRFVTIRDVEAGEELTHDYGTEWWESRGREPSE